MFLQNLLTHMKGKGVLVNGRRYLVGQDLVICDDAGKHQDVPEADAQRLLADAKAWAVFDPKATAKPVIKPASTPRISLVTGTGELIPPLPKAEPAPPVAVPPKVENKKSEAPPIPTVKVDPPIPQKGEDWADPSEDCSLKWLQLCAKAYRIKYKGKDKASLITEIKAAMYD